MATVRGPVRDGTSKPSTLVQPSTPKRASFYPINLSKRNPSPLSDSSNETPHRPEARASGAVSDHQYQSLEQLLSQAGYADTRVITPEAVRIKERVQRLWAEEKALAEREERDEVEGLLFEAADVGKKEPKDGSFNGWSIGRAQGARLLEEGPISVASPSRPLRTRASALGLTFAADGEWSSPAAAAGTDDRPRASKGTTTASRHAPADDCGSLSSASSTASSDSTMITSPPESATETFARVHVESPPNDERTRPLLRSAPYARTPSGSPDDEELSPSSSVRSSSTVTAPRAIPPSTSPHEDNLAQSAAARSLRKFASQTTLRMQPSFTSTSKRSIRPKKSLARPASAAPPHPPVPEDDESVATGPTSVVRKALRHAASTPFMRSATATISSSSDVKGKAPEGWFASFSRFALARSVTEPVPVQSLRSRPSIPSFQQTQSGSSSLRGMALPAQVTKHSVTCVSDEGDNLPPFAAMRIRPKFPGEEEDEEVAGPQTPPVLTPRVDYGAAEAWRYGGSAHSSPEITEGGWDWGAGPSSSPTADPPTINVTRLDSSSSSPLASPPPLPRPLRAQRSIKSLRATLVAHPAPAPPPVPPLPLAHVKIPAFAISSPGTLERGLPPRTLDLSDEAISRMGKGRWTGVDQEEGDGDAADAYEVAAAVDARVSRDADARGRSKKRGSRTKGIRR